MGLDTIDCRQPLDYYYRGGLEEFGIDEELDATRDIAASVNSATTGKDRLWLVLGHVDENPPIEAYLVQRYGAQSVLIQRQFLGVRVLLFDLAAESPAGSRE